MIDPPRLDHYLLSMNNYDIEIKKAYERHYMRRHLVFDNIKPEDTSEITQWEAKLWAQCEDELIEIHKKYYKKREAKPK